MSDQSKSSESGEGVESVEKKPFLATHDPLTDLPNRLLFFDRLEQTLAMAKRYQYLFALLLLKVDDFKLISAKLPDAGKDQLLRGIARRLAKSVRESDTVARLSLDRFAVILTKLTQPDDALKVSKTVLDVISMPLTIEESHHQATFSIGVAIYPQDGESTHALLDTAASSLENAIASGGNQCHWPIPE